MEQINTNDNHENLEKIKQKAFKEYQEIMEQIYADGFSKYAEKLDNLNEAFEGCDNCVRCVDEGTPGGVHSAGSGILRDENEVIESFKKAGVKKITSHDGCGAAAYYAKLNDLDSTKSDEYGKEWSQKIATALDIPYEHIDASDMNRSIEFHNARISYYDGTGKFDYSKVEGLPPGFIISRNIQSLDVSLEEVGISQQIALGDHGFGELFSQDNPFLIVAIAESEEALAELKEELSNLENLPKTVTIDGFVTPKN